MAEPIYLKVRFAGQFIERHLELFHLAVLISRSVLKIYLWIHQFLAFQQLNRELT